MSALTLACALLLADVPTPPPPPTTAEPPRFHLVQLKLVECRFNEGQRTVIPPKQSLWEGQLMHFHHEVERGWSRSFRLGLEDEDADSDWFVLLDRTSKGQLRVHVTIHRHSVEKLADRGVVITGPAVTIIQQVEPGKTSKVVLGRERRGSPRAWLEVTVQPQVNAQDEGIAEEAEVRPFWYEPF